MICPIIDTHTHIYYQDEEPKWDFSGDIDQVMDRAEGAGVAYFLLPNIDLGSYPRMMNLVERYPQRCFPMIGLHPTEVNDHWEEVLNELRGHLIAKPKAFIAIGEIGLDFHWSIDYREEMISAFTEQLNWACEMHLPVSIHCRDAEDEVMDILDKYRGNELTGVLHSFSGNLRQLQRAIEDFPNLMIGVNGSFTFKNNPLRKCLNGLLPLGRIVVETDAPFLAPSPYRGKRNEPSYLPVVIEKIAEVYEKPIAEVQKQLFENSIKVYQLPD